MMACLARPIAALASLALLAGATKMDPDNPTCPDEPQWGHARRMTLTTAEMNGKHVLLAEGIIDSTLPGRLEKALNEDETIGEVWLRSRGGDARAGNAAGKVIRSIPGMTTRIPAGATCFSSCNFVFMGGDRRIVEPGGIFMVHMFTHTGQRDAIEIAREEGSEETVALIGEIEQASALLASEDNDFLIRMGVSRKLLTEIMYRQNATSGSGNRGKRYCLSQEEVRKYNVMPLETRG